MISNLPTNINQTTDHGVSTAVVTWTPPTAADNSGYQDLTSSHTPGDSFPIGDTKVVYTATDASNNFVTGSFIVSVHGK